MSSVVNWYDIVVFVVLMYGIWSGIRTGFSGEIIRVLGLLLMVILAMSFYQPLGRWLQGVSSLTEDLANLLAFLGIAIVVYLIAAAVRLAVHRRMRELRTTALIENVGGGVAGFLRMAVVMAWLSVMLALTNSPFWQQQVAQKSQFGSFVVRQFPAVAAVVERKFPEKTAPFMEDLRRRPDPDFEKNNSGK
jgi:membrane protein required for colicin V production